jgi:hypothetical protein
MVNLNERSLNHWVEIFCEARIGRALGISFSKFMENPKRNLELAHQETAPECLRNGFLPLLPAQAATSKRIRDRWAEEPSHTAQPLPDAPKTGGVDHE